MLSFHRLLPAAAGIALSLLLASAPGDPVAASEPLTGQEICERLTAADVGAAIGREVGTPSPSTSGTPQCSYPYKEGSSAFNVTVAYQRVDGDLGGMSGMQGFDYVAQMQRGNPGNTESEVDAGDKALRFSGAYNLHYGLLLVGDRVMTVLAFSTSVDGAAVDALLQKMATTFAE